jgi:hypothetical protein
MEKPSLTDFVIFPFGLMFDSAHRLVGLTDAGFGAPLTDLYHFLCLTSLPDAIIFSS